MAGIEILTDREIQSAIRAVKAAGAVRTIQDGGGLTLQIRPSGAGWWRLRYWIDTRENRLSLGTYPKVSLAVARQRRRDAQKLIAEGIDPSQARKADKARRKAAAVVDELVAQGKPLPGTFEAVACEWLDTVHEAKVTVGHAARTRIRFEQDAFPWIGRRPLAAIEPPELLQLLRRVEARGAIETAHRLKDACGQVFRFGIAAGYCARNPAADLKDALRPVPTRHHAAIVEPGRAGELLRAMGDYAGHPVTRAALALSALLFLRPGELRQLEWAWVDFDAALITVPGMLMKRRKADKANGVPHLVPLAPQALAVLRELQAITGGAGRRYCFPSMHTGERPMSENTVNVALRRMGFDRETATAHGFRAMARTMAAERLDVPPEVIEAQLAHSVSDALGRAYNRTQYLGQRRELMLKWADYLDRLRKGAEVVALPGRAA